MLGVTEDDDADLADVEVLGQTQRAVGELEQLVGHRAGKALDGGNSVTGLDDAADLFTLTGGRVIGLDVFPEGVANLIGANGQLGHDWPLICRGLAADYGRNGCLRYLRGWPGGRGHADGARPARQARELRMSGLTPQLPTGRGEPANHCAVDQLAADAHRDPAEHRGVDHQLQHDLRAERPGDRGAEAVCLLLVDRMGKGHHGDGTLPAR